MSSNTTVIGVGQVGAGEASSAQLGHGVYSLNKRSNVPFIGLVGSSGFRKTVSWGEIAEVPCDELVTVVNQSFHSGDIWLNKGRDPCNRPSRITVPVEYEISQYNAGEGVQDLWRAKYPCDVRGAKRAYLSVDATVLSDTSGMVTYIRGRRLDGSMETANSLAPLDAPFGPGVGYLSAMTLPVNTALVLIPLGMGAIITDDTRPHVLLDASDVFFLLGPTGNPLSDSLGWPLDSGTFGFPSGRAAAPGAWYTIEYD